MDNQLRNPMRAQMAVSIAYIVLNLVYIVRIALELSLGLCIVTNALESLHVVASVTAVVLFMIR